MILNLSCQSGSSRVFEIQYNLSQIIFDQTKLSGEVRLLRKPTLVQPMCQDLAWRFAVGGWRSAALEVGGRRQRSEDRGQTAEDRRQREDFRLQIGDCGFFNRQWR